MKLLTGNDLKTGFVTWWTGADWSLHIEDAVDVGEAGNFERNAYARACRSAMQMYAVERPAQLIEAVRAHLAETTKVRSALSQHQKVAGEMCEILKCSSKEELPSSVRELIRRVREAIGEPPVGEVVVED